MLQRRLTGAGAVTIVLVLTGCGDRPIEDDLVRPGITAIDDSRSEACGINAATLRTAIDAYTMLAGVPPADEQALVDEGFLREPTADWEVVDGQLVAENPACGEVGETAAPPTVVDIVTDAATEPLTPDEVFEAMSADQVAAVGGDDCARELASIFAAAERFVADTEREPTDFADLVDGGFLGRLPLLWIADGDELLPAPDSHCETPG